MTKCEIWFIYDSITCFQSWIVQFLSEFCKLQPENFRTSSLKRKAKRSLQPAFALFRGTAFEHTLVESPTWKNVINCYIEALALKLEANCCKDTFLFWNIIRLSFRWSRTIIAGFLESHLYAMKSLCKNSVNKSVITLFWICMFSILLGKVNGPLNVLWRWWEGAWLWRNSLSYVEK